jgi:hypothetical protein
MGYPAYPFKGITSSQSTTSLHTRHVEILMTALAPSVTLNEAARSFGLIFLS